MGILSSLFKSLEPVIIKLDGINNIIVSNKKEAEFYGAGMLKIANDCANLVNTTKNPRVFFERYNLLIEKLENLSKLEQFHCFSGNLPSITLKETLDKKFLTINEFIGRYYQDTLSKINTLKTPKAKDKKIQQFYDELSKYNEYMLHENITNYTILHKKLINKQNN